MNFLEWFFPPRCLLCGKRLAPGGVLCESCEKDRPQKPRERRFRLTGDRGEAFLVVTPFVYEGGCRKAIHRMKFEGRKALSGPFGKIMAKAAQGLGPFDGVAWVPMSKKGKKARGYDQSQCLAKAVAKEWKLPLLPLLEKTRTTATQHELSRQERLENVKQAFAASSDAKGKRVLLIDDIITTGATMVECALALYRAGAEEVVGLCAAEARLEGEKQ